MSNRWLSMYEKKYRDKYLITKDGKIKLKNGKPNGMIPKSDTYKSIFANNPIVCSEAIRKRHGDFNLFPLSYTNGDIMHDSFEILGYHEDMESAWDECKDHTIGDSYIHIPNEFTAIEGKDDTMYITFKDENERAHVQVFGQYSQQVASEIEFTELKF